ncbi:MAG TPA: MATE family efflux transporter [Stellaceae bacterium]|nr:MATE family efflux transporter [Stellaceae bacterium]
MAGSRNESDARPGNAAQMRRRRLLHGAIVPTLLALAAPTMVVLVVQTLVGVAETYFVSFLGTDALAGVALVFPVLMLMQMMSNGGIGGGVASAVARALGAGRQADADALVLHALVIAAAFGLVFSAAEFLGGRALYRALGGEGRVLAAALAYADVVFSGAVLVWIVSLLAAALRGAGNVMVPAIVTLAGAVVLVPLSPALIFGLGPLPRLGIAGAGVAVVTYYLGAAIALLWYLRSGRSAFRLTLDPRRIERRLLADVLRVGGLSAIGTVQSNLTVVLVTGAVGLFGTDAIAGYGIASRLDYMMIPLLFALGTAALTMVGTNIGAGQAARARRIAWTSALIAAGFTEAIGLAAAFFPTAWLGLFSSDPGVLATGALYLRLAGPAYGAFGLAMLLYFSGQGAGRVLWPVIAGTARLVIAAGIGWLVVARLGGGLGALFLAVAAASLAFGTITAASQWLGAWGRGRAAPAPALAPLSATAPPR